jgi:predicted PurR-regulated permease PerM
MSSNSPGSKAAAPAAVSPAPQFRILDWLPWEKLLIWGLFILAVYALRHFFFIIFVTFIVSYIMRSGVRRISQFVLGGRENVWLERVLTVAGFVLLLFGFYAGGSYVGPELYRQGQALVQRATTLEPEKEFNNFITRTFGVIFFQWKYRSRTDEKYRASFEDFERKQGPSRVAYAEFGELSSSLAKAFEAEEAQKIEGKLTDKEFQAWFIREKSPILLEQDREKLVKRWEQKYQEAAEHLGLPSLEELKANSSYETSFREPRVKEMIFKDLVKSSKEYTEYRKEWQSSMVSNALAILKSSPNHEQRFREFYERLRKGDIAEVAVPEGKPPYSFEKYLELKEAYERGEQAFQAVLEGTAPADETQRLALAQANFEQSETRRLVREWIESPAYLKMREVAIEYGESGLKSIASWVQQTIGFVIFLPLQFALALLLSFFITWDIPRIRRALLGLRKSRVSDFYAEIAPGLYNFGRLIGRAFQAQGVIALFNTLLTFVAIRFLGIQNEVFLCAIVFVCSFIPVLGVVLSSVPISIIAIVQPGGSIFLALEAIGAILVIHFIETSVLNPKILGEMLHLHPVLVLAVLAIGEHFFGVWGLLLAVPVTVFIIRCVILDEEIPGLIEQDPLAKVESSFAEAAIVTAPPSDLSIERPSAPRHSAHPAPESAETSVGSK